MRPFLHLVGQMLAAVPCQTGLPDHLPSPHLRVSLLLLWLPQALGISGGLGACPRFFLSASPESCELTSQPSLWPTAPPWPGLLLPVAQDLPMVPPLRSYSRVSGTQEAVTPLREAFAVGAQQPPRPRVTRSPVLHLDLLVSLAGHWGLKAGNKGGWSALTEVHGELCQGSAGLGSQSPGGGPGPLSSRSSAGSSVL